MKYSILIFILFVTSVCNSQGYTNYYTGNLANATTNPEGGVCMMGGATEHDEAMKWFLERADGGDVLVLRTSGSDGYNDYMFSDLGINVNSVETIVFNSPTAADESYVHNKIQQAEAIWFAGGDQWNYISYWRDNAIDSLINDAINNRNIVIGGTSAGMAILGKYYFSASLGTVTSETALNNPYASTVKVDSTHFLEIDYLDDVITDSHYDDPNRKGRHLVFLARILTDTGVSAKGIACNEYTSVCIDENGLASVYGDWPSYDEDAYFLQVNCELENINPEHCQPNIPLSWNRDASAVRVYKVHGTNNGSNTFDLSDWQSGSGGEWMNWYAVNGEFFEESGEMIDCSSVSIQEPNGLKELKMYPNPNTGKFIINAPVVIENFIVFGSLGKQILSSSPNLKNFEIDLTNQSNAIYLVQLFTKEGIFNQKIIVER